MRAMGLTWWCVGMVLGLAIPAMAVEPTVLPEPYAAGPVASGYVEVSGVKLYHEIHGRGEPVLLLHGGLGSSEEFAPVIPALAAHYRVILYDRRGHGRSYDTPEPFVYAAMATEARAFMDAIGVASAAVVGFSDGGVVGYHLASAYPGRVTRLLASGANYRVNGMTPATIDWIRTRMTTAAIAEDVPGLVASYAARGPAGGDLASFLKRSQDLWLRDPYIGADELRRITIPVLLLAGDTNDLTPEHMLEIHRLIAGSQLGIVPNCNHFIVSRKPALFTMLALDFLAGR
ncbi:MAG: alpha/beta hydrolase [Thermoanaerobaculaceae bacterium]|nr:alpha/beta hydrolase [Thermoanaerobaculaceae bacterium]